MYPSPMSSVNDKLRSALTRLKEETLHVMEYTLLCVDTNTLETKMEAQMDREKSR